VRKRKNCIVGALLAAMIMCAMIAVFALQSTVAPQCFRSNHPARTAAFLTHAPIHIIGDADFTAAKGVTGGSGTSTDPYIIEGWDVNASHADGISIENTRSYFVVASCFVHDGGDYHSGIVLFNSTNGRIADNLCSNDYWGIGLFLSNYSTVVNNTCTGGFYGMYLLYCGNELIRDNNCSNNVEAMYIWYTSNSFVLSNDCSSGSLGIQLDTSDNNTVGGNECDSTVYGIAAAVSSDNIIENNNCSSDTMCGIFLSSSTRNYLIGNNCSAGSQYGIWIDDGGNNTLTINNCSRNAVYGIFLLLTDNNTVTFNKLCNNSRFGVFLGFVTNANIVVNNTFIGNNGATVAYDADHSQACDNGTGNLWNTSGNPHGYGNWWSDWTTPDANYDGVVDVPHAINGSAGAQDHYPLANTSQVPIPEFGMMPLAAVLVVLSLIMLMGADCRRKKH
jgi:parallel beta-helix repeat protein